MVVCCEFHENRIPTHKKKTKIRETEKNLYKKNYRNRHEELLQTIFNIIYQVCSSVVPRVPFQMENI